MLFFNHLTQTFATKLKLKFNGILAVTLSGHLVTVTIVFSSLLQRKNVDCVVIAVIAYHKPDIKINLTLFSELDGEFGQSAKIEDAQLKWMHMRKSVRCAWANATWLLRRLSWWLACLKWSALVKLKLSKLIINKHLQRFEGKVKRVSNTYKVTISEPLLYSR